jgi:nitrogen regulatory protein PII
MKEIKAIIQPSKARAVLEALHRIEGVAGVMSSDVRCTSAARGCSNPDINTKIELMVPDEIVERVLEAIQSSARTGRVGDGSIFVTDVACAVRIASS